MTPEKQLSLALAAIVGILMVGTAGYVVIEDWTVLDAVYMTVISLTTVGFQEVQPLSENGKIFTLALILGGVATATATVTIGTQILLAGQLQKVMGRRKLEKEIKKIEGHYIICGYGRMGRIICSEFQRKPVPFVVIEESPEVFTRISADILAIQGNASEEDVLLEAGIKRARGLVSVASSDADNVYITLTATTIMPRFWRIPASRMVFSPSEELPPTRTSSIWSSRCSRFVTSSMKSTTAGRRMALAIPVPPMV
jgi:voltage-gated potassium channel